MPVSVCTTSEKLPVETERPKVVLLSDLKCCQKYRHTLPDHVELVSGVVPSEGMLMSAKSSKSLIFASETLKPSTSSIMQAASSRSSKKSLFEAGDMGGLEETEEDEETDEEEMLGNEVCGEFEGEDEIGEEEEEYEPSICSEWIVLKPEKRYRTKAKPPVETSVSDLNEPAGNRRLLNRPDSPEGEVFDKTNKMIPSNFIKYEGFHKFWPEPPPYDEAVLKRPPSPATSMPKIPELPELTGEDWLWFEGRYLEGGTLNVVGEDGEFFYRLPKQWKEGHWEPSPALLEKWEKEELLAEQERQRKEAEQRKYDEILKRADSPGMDIMNWGDGPVRLTNWMTLMKDPLGELSQLFPRYISDQILFEASEMNQEAFGRLSSQIEEALASNSYDMVRDILISHFSDKLDMRSEIFEMSEVGEGHVVCDPVQYGTVSDFNITASFAASKKGLSSTSKLVSKSRSVTFVINRTSSMEESGEVCGESEKEGSFVFQPVEREIVDDILPESFRQHLLEFIRHYVSDLPHNPLKYALKYFEDRVPIVKETNQETVEARVNPVVRRMAIKQMTGFEDSFEVFDKPQEDVDKLVKTLNDCWFTKALDMKTLLAVVEVMYEIEFSQNEVILDRDDPMNTFYVIKKGAVQIENDQEVQVVKDRGFFGETSLNVMLAQNFKSPHKVTALSDGSLWCLRSGDFANVLATFKEQREYNLMTLIQSLDLFQNATDDEKYNVIDTMETRYYKKKDVIFCQKSIPEGLYFFLDGTFKFVKLSKVDEKVGSDSKNRGKYKYVSKTYASPRAVGRSIFCAEKPWDYSCVAKSNIVEVAILKTDVFERLFGDVEDLLHRPPAPPRRRRPPTPVATAEVDGEMEIVGEAAAERPGEWGERDEETGPIKPKKIPWLVEKKEEETTTTPVIQEPTLQEILDAMWFTPDPSCDDGNRPRPCGCASPTCDNAYDMIPGQACCSPDGWPKDLSFT